MSVRERSVEMNAHAHMQLWLSRKKPDGDESDAESCHTYPNYPKMHATSRRTPEGNDDEEIMSTVSQPPMYHGSEGTDQDTMVGDEKASSMEEQPESTIEVKAEVHEADEPEVPHAEPTENVMVDVHISESLDVPSQEDEKIKAEIIESESGAQKSPTPEPQKQEASTSELHKADIRPLASDDGATNEMTTEKPTDMASEESAKPCTREEFDDEMNKVFGLMTAKKYNFNMIRQLSEMLQPNFKFDIETTKRVIDMLAKVTEEIDIRLREYFLPLVRKVFMQCANYHEAMRYLYGQSVFERESSRMPNYYIPYRDNFNREITRIQSRICPFEQMDEGTMEELTKELGFLMMITPQETAVNFLLWSISAQPVIPTVTRLFERLPALVDYRIQHVATTDMYDSFWIEIFKLLFTKHDKMLKLDTEDGRNGFQHIVLNFLRTRVKMQRTAGDKLMFTVTNRPNLDATEFVVKFLFEHLSRNCETRIMLSLMSALMSTNDKSRYDIRWKKSEEDLDIGCVDPNIFVAYPIHVFIYAGDLDPPGYAEICALMPKLFTGIAKKFAAEGIKINANFVLAKTSNLDWAYKYAMGMWLQSVLEGYKPEIPASLYYCLPDDKKECHCRLATEDPISINEDFFCSIFELALVLPEAALDFLGYATCATPDIEDISVQICMALAKTTHNEKKVSRLLALRPVIDRLIDLYAVPLLTYGLISFYSIDAATAKGLSDMLGGLMFGEAVRIYLLQKKEDGERPFLEDNVKLMLIAFSNLINPFINDFIEVLRVGNQRGKAPSITPGPLIAISNQLAVTRFLVNAIEELLHVMGKFDWAPHQFQLLSERLATCIKNWFDTMLAPNLDDFKRSEGEDAIRTVYAYTPPTEDERKVDQSEKMQYFENMLEQLEKDAIPRPMKRQVKRQQHEKNKSGTFHNKPRK